MNSGSFRINLQANIKILGEEIAGVAVDIDSTKGKFKVKAKLNLFDFFNFEGFVNISLFDLSTYLKIDMGKESEAKITEKIREQTIERIFGRNDHRNKLFNV